MLPALIPIALSLAPMLARWVGGSDAAAVTAQVAEAARAVVGSDDAAEVARRIEADPARRADLAVELARIAAEREAAEHRARVEELRIAAADLADARALARSGPLAWGAGLVTAAAFAMLTAIVALLVLADVPAGNRELLVTVAGGVLVLVQSAAAFWVGSSAGSAAKSGLLGGPLGRTRP